jgi:peptidoglycan/xylan/chitin deacetylase (PgdA/CDA1 family)
VRPAALVLTYHAIARGPAPLFVEPSLFAEHLDRIVAAGTTVLTVSELAAALRAGTLPARAIALTFDDGFGNVYDNAAPLLAERGLRATVFCVAGHVGGVSDWASQPRSAPRLPLANETALSALASAGWEIGSHGVSHEPLARLSPEACRRELIESRDTLESVVGVAIKSFAYPYGSIPDGSRKALGEARYEAACTTQLAPVSTTTDPLALPRVDAHYLRRPALLEAVVSGKAPGYLSTRRLAARARRLVVRDYARGAAP